MSKIWDALKKVEQNRDGEPTHAVRRTNGVALTQKQALAIRFLLECDSLSLAAKNCGVAERTLRKWLDQPEFVAAYCDAGEELMARSLQRLRAASNDAVEVLRTALRDDDPMVRIGAAAAILQASGVAGQRSGQSNNGGGDISGGEG